MHPTDTHFQSSIFAPDLSNDRFQVLEHSLGGVRPPDATDDDNAASDVTDFLYDVAAELKIWPEKEVEVEDKMEKIPLTEGEKRKIITDIFQFIM